MATKTTTVSRLKDLYKREFVPQLHTELALENVNQVPKLEKVTINVGLGRAKEDKRMFEVAANTLRKITGQQPVETIAKKSIASFKLREGMKIGLMVTLRGEKMYEFVDRLATLVLPRVRDFHGIPATAFDGQGNYSLGLTDQSVFPELTFDEVSQLHGLQINFVISCQQPQHARALLEKFGLPFEKSTEKGKVK